MADRDLPQNDTAATASEVALAQLKWAQLHSLGYPVRVNLSYYGISSATRESLQTLSQSEINSLTRELITYLSKLGGHRIHVERFAGQREFNEAYRSRYSGDLIVDRSG